MDYDMDNHKFYITTCYGKWLLSDHAIQRIKSRFKTQVDSFQKYLSSETTLKCIMKYSDTPSVLLKHYLLYANNNFFVIVLVSTKNKKNTKCEKIEVVKTILTEDIYRSQCMAVNLSSHKDQIIRELIPVNANKDKLDKEDPLLNDVVNYIKKMVDNTISKLPVDWPEYSFSELLKFLSDKKRVKLLSYLKKLVGIKQKEPYKSYLISLNKIIKNENIRIDHKHRNDAIQKDKNMLISCINRLNDIRLRDLLLHNMDVIDNMNDPDINNKSINHPSVEWTFVNTSDNFTSLYDGYIYVMQDISILNEIKREFKKINTSLSKINS